MQDEPNNQSPDTITDDEPVTIGEVADAVVEKLRGLIPGLGAAAGSGDGNASETPPAGNPEASAPPPPLPSPAPVPAGQDVESTVRRILAEKDTENRITAVEEKVNAPVEPKPDRKGIAAAIFGKSRG